MFLNNDTQISQMTTYKPQLMLLILKNSQKYVRRIISINKVSFFEPVIYEIVNMLQIGQSNYLNTVKVNAKQIKIIYTGFRLFINKKKFKE